MYENCWGKELLVDCFDCDRDKVQDPAYIKQWIINLVDTIKMKAYGDPLIVHFGESDPKLTGWTAIQLIETSNISAHFNDADGSAAINVFSCAEFSMNEVIDQISTWFKPTSMEYTLIRRLET
jgi:S-adenosylmethionine/arginine decarboxylase-like enzyme